MKTSSQHTYTHLSNVLTPFKTFLFLFIHSLFLILGWHTQFTVFLLFFAFVPVFYFLDFSPKCYNEKVKLCIFSFLAVFLWIYSSIYWIKPIHPISHFIISLLSTIEFLIPYILAYSLRFSTRKFFGVSKLVFIFVWLVIELLHDFNVLGFPYLNLGHALGAYPNLIQWYSYTGSIGGTIWILLVNLSLYHFLRRLVLIKPVLNQGSIWNWIVTISFIGFPVFFSFYSGRNNQKGVETSFNIICVHTSADVYDYKYEVEPEVLLEEYLTYTLNYIDLTQQNLIVWPENALTGDIFLSELDSSPAIKKIKQELCNRPNNILITGAMVDEKIDSPNPKVYHPNVLYNNDEKYYFKRYNSALFIRSNAPTLMQTKKRMVPFGEKIPAQKIFSPLVSLLPNLANLNFSSKEEVYPVFSILSNRIRTSPVICYGSAFSDHVADEVLKTKSNVIVVIMNEGWMKSEKAYNHFNWFSICRAIENRRQLVKSSNEGKSALINLNGIVEESVTGVGAKVIKSKLYINDNYSFFTLHHSVIHYGILIVGLVFVFISFFIPFSDKNR